MTNEKWNKPVGVVCVVLLSAVVIVDMETNAESMLAGLDNEFCYDTVSQYDDIINKTKPLVDEIKAQDTDFYRINQGYYEYSKNDSMLFGYNGMAHYSSTYNAAVNSLTSSLGISQGYFFNSGYGSNALLDSLFAVKYLLEDKTIPKSYIKYSDSEKGASLYENPLMLSIAYGSTPSTLSPELGYGPFANQNNYISAITGENVTCFTDYVCNTVRDGNEWSYDFTADSDNPVYLYMKASGTSSADVYVNDSFIGNYFSNETNGTLFLGNFENGQQVNVHVVAYADETVDLSYSEIAELHMDVLEPVLQGLQKNGMQIENHKNGTLSGKITLEEGQTIMTSIPYDEGWTVWIDGKKAETMMFANTFMAIKCSAGEHEIRFTYVSPGVMTGVWICILSLGIAALYFGLERLCHVLKSWRS